VHYPHITYILAAITAVAVVVYAGWSWYSDRHGQTSVTTTVTGRPTLPTA
jgi:hypothetical protein